MYVSGCDVFVSWCGSIAYFSALFVTNFDTTSTIVGPRTLLLCFIIHLFFAPLGVLPFIVLSFIYF